MGRLELFHAALDAAQAHLERWGEHRAILSIIAQLDYLEGLETGRLSDRSHLKDITLGVLAAREIEAGDLGLAELLRQVSAEAAKMRADG